MEYGVIIAPKHLAFNDTEINRTGVSVFMTEQQARENELRGTQGIVENAHVLGVMTAYNRVGITQDNAHTGLTKNILRNEWGFQGLISEDFIQNANYVVLKEAVLNGVTMSCNTGDNTMAAVSEKVSLLDRRGRKSGYHHDDRPEASYEVPELRTGQLQRYGRHGQQHQNWSASVLGTTTP